MTPAEMTLGDIIDRLLQLSLAGIYTFEGLSGELITELDAREKRWAALEARVAAMETNGTPVECAHSETEIRTLVAGLGAPHCKACGKYVGEIHINEPAPPVDAEWTTIGELKPGEWFESRGGGVGRVSGICEGNFVVSVLYPGQKDAGDGAWKPHHSVRRLRVVPQSAIVVTDDESTVERVANAVRNHRHVFYGTADFEDIARRILEALRGGGVK